MIDPRYYVLCLRNALVFLRQLAAQRPHIVFVLSGNHHKAGIRKIVFQAAHCLGQTVITNNWTPGLLTNWRGVGARHSVACAQSHVKARFPLAHGFPDVLIILDGYGSSELAIREARKAGVPMVVLSRRVQIESTPEFVIPVNPDSYTEVYTCLQSVCRAYLQGFR